MRGGARAGAGRPPKIDCRAERMADLAKRLRQTRGIGPRAAVALAAFGASDEVVAAAIGCGAFDVARLFEKELHTGRAIGTGQLIQALWRKADSGSTAAIRELERRISGGAR